MKKRDFITVLIALAFLLFCVFVAFVVLPVLADKIKM